MMSMKHRIKEPEFTIKSHLFYSHKDYSMSRSFSTGDKIRLAEYNLTSR